MKQFGALLFIKKKQNEKRSYGDDSKTMLLACVEDEDLWFTNTSLGELRTTWSTKWPTEDGRNRVPFCVNAEFRLYEEEEKLSKKCALVHFFKFLNYMMELESGYMLLRLTMLTKQSLTDSVM